MLGRFVHAQPLMEAAKMQGEEDAIALNGASDSYGVLLQDKLTLKDFEWTTNEWPTLGYRDFSPSLDLPLFSLSPLHLLDNCTALHDLAFDAPASAQLCKSLVEASYRWGFFQVTDHGIPLDLLRQAQQSCLHFFNKLPLEQKQRGARPTGLPLGYSSSNPDYGINLPWTEILQLQQSPEKIDMFAARIWGASHRDHTTFAETLIKYIKALERLGMVILQMLAVGLGVERDYFCKHFTEGDSTLIRVNRYPPCPESSKILGLGQHTDPQSLTLLLQDEVGGLQVLMDNVWVAVKPCANCFVVNVGDTLEAWSNA